MVDTELIEAKTARRNIELRLQHQKDVYEDYIILVSKVNNAIKNNRFNIAIDSRIENENIKKFEQKGYKIVFESDGLGTYLISW